MDLKLVISEAPPSTLAKYPKPYMYLLASSTQTVHVPIKSALKPQDRLHISYFGVRVFL